MILPPAVRESSKQFFRSLGLDEALLLINKNRLALDRDHVLRTLKSRGKL